MRAAKKQPRIVEPEDVPGAMMQYKPMNEKETAMMVAWIEKKKAAIAKKKSKATLKKVLS
jgi:hypothetical protein